MALIQTFTGSDGAFPSSSPLSVDAHSIRSLVTVNRLSRILMDVTSPALHIDGRQWRSGIGKILESYFSILWKDAQEEIRLAVRAVVTGLLPAQIEAAAQCWTEALTTSPMKEKIELISFLLQLRPHLHGWKRELAFLAARYPFLINRQ